LARGAEFLTEPKEHGPEIRAYIRDPDGQSDRGRPNRRPSRVSRPQRDAVVG
jgi:hypothetical protein